MMKVEDQAEVLRRSLVKWAETMGFTEAWCPAGVPNAQIVRLKSLEGDRYFVGLPLSASPIEQDVRRIILDQIHLTTEMVGNLEHTFAFTATNAQDADDWVIPVNGMCSSISMGFHSGIIPMVDICMPDDNRDIWIIFFSSTSPDKGALDANR